MGEAPDSRSGHTGRGAPVQARDVDPAGSALQKAVMADFPVTIYHNPRCSKSRTALELIRERGIEPEIVLYLQTGWTEATLKALLKRMGLKARDILRTGEAAAAVLGTNASDDVVIAAMVADPILVERPIVETPKGVVVGRPIERVLEVL